MDSVFQKNIESILIYIDSICRPMVEDKFTSIISLTFIGFLVSWKEAMAAIPQTLTNDIFFLVDPPSKSIFVHTAPPESHSSFNRFLQY